MIIKNENVKRTLKFDYF